MDSGRSLDLHSLGHHFLDHRSLDLGGGGLMQIKKENLKSAQKQVRNGVNMNTLASMSRVFSLRQNLIFHPGNPLYQVYLALFLTS